jgi:hypothetical protein
MRRIAVRPRPLDFAVVRPLTETAHQRHDEIAVALVSAFAPAAWVAGPGKWRSGREPIK